MASICVFCGSRSGDHPGYAQAATELGKSLAGDGHRLIYGGGSTGIMGALADAMLAHGGEITGVIPSALANVELMHADVQDMRIVPDMHVRKATMHSLADGYIALPGGFGTMEELFEVLCWAQLAFHTAPIAVLNTDGIYDGLLTMIRSMYDRGFIGDSCRNLLSVPNEMKQLRSWLNQHFGPATAPED
ncbi:MAG: TIGR00730 family Rossman fold protein [Fuerstiella sp.]